MSPVVSLLLFLPVTWQARPWRTRGLAPGTSWCSRINSISSVDCYQQHIARKNFQILPTIYLRASSPCMVNASWTCSAEETQSKQSWSYRGRDDASGSQSKLCHDKISKWTIVNRFPEGYRTSAEIRTQPWNLWINWLPFPEEKVVENNGTLMNSETPEQDTGNRAEDQSPEPGYKEINSDNKKFPNCV